LGLIAAVEWAAEEFEARTGTTCRLDLPQNDGAIDPDRAIAVFRILQETLTNVARHANATCVDVRLLIELGGVILEVHDNGRGATDEQLSAAESLGIRGMRERALLLGGELLIRGVPEQGTSLRVSIPLIDRNLREREAT
jgi:signal transduction histidine kinase